MKRNRVIWIHLWRGPDGPRVAVGRTNRSGNKVYYNPTDASIRRISNTVFHLIIAKGKGKCAPSIVGYGWSWIL